MITIRHANREDLDWIVAMEREIFSTPWSRNGFEFELECGDAVFAAAVDDGEPAGFIIMHTMGPQAEIFNVAVSPAHRRKGAADAMMTYVLKKARELGVEQIFLEVRRSNAAAQALYRKYGFGVGGVRPGYYDEPKEDAILMDCFIGTESGI
jgi:ribosomal-protein-alanine N-acetyltransferase